MGESIRGRVIGNGICKDDIQKVLQREFESRTIILGLSEIGDFVFMNRSKATLEEAQKKVTEVLKRRFGDKVILTNTDKVAEAA